MKHLIHNHLYKLIYFIICILTIFSVLKFEHNVYLDEKSVLNTKTSMLVNILSVPKYSEDSVRFIAVPKDSDIKCFVSVRIKYARNLKLLPGDNLKLRGVLTIPPESLNKGGFSYKNYLKSQGASLSFESNSYEISYHKKGFLAPIYEARSKITDAIFKHISPREAGLVNALVTGDKDKISDSLKESFRRAGVYHIVAVSGLHLNLVVIFVSMLFIKLSLKRRIKTFISFALTTLVCAFMFIFTGFGVSVERAALMAVAVCLAGIFMREYSPFASLFTAMVIVLISEPYSYLDVSFCLSFAATAGVLVGLELIKRWNISSKRFSYLIESVIITQCASIATLPYLVYWFNTVSIIGILSNIVIVSIMPILLALSYIFAIICLISPEFLCVFFANMLTTVSYAVIFLTETFAKLPFSYVPLSTNLLSLIICEIALSAICVKLRKKQVKIVLLLIVAVANISLLWYNISTDKSEVTFLNVDQGDCSVIQGSDGSVIMIDCGSESQIDIAQNEIIPHLKRRGIFKVDSLFITHYHIDHTNGVIPMIESGYVKNLILPDRAIYDDEKIVAGEIHKYATKHNVPIVYVSEGDVIKCGKLHTFEILNPPFSTPENANEASVVINYKYKNTSVLYMSDTEEYTQYRIRENLPDCDIVKIAHHGAKCSMSDKTAKKVKAQYAVISCGKNNRYSHPDIHTLTAYNESEILRTDTEGTITFTFKNDRITLRR